KAGTQTQRLQRNTMNVSYSKSPEKSTCPHCNSGDLYTEPHPPHLGLFCRSCSKWVKGIRSSQVIEPKSSFDSPHACRRAEIRKLQHKIQEHDRQLSVLTRILGANQKHGKEFRREITDSQIENFVKGVGQ